MQTSQSIKEISAALVKAQAKMGAAKKENNNPFFKSKYADLGSIMEVVKGPLNDVGIMVLQPVGHDDAGDYVETILLHSSGEYIADKMRITVKTEHNPQDQGSAITYARRYSLQSLCFIPAEDDDGEKATDHDKVIPKSAPVSTDIKTIQTILSKCEPGSTKTGKKKWTVYDMQDVGYSTLADYHMEKAIEIIERGCGAEISYAVTPYGNDLKTIKAIGEGVKK